MIDVRERGVVEISEGEPDVVSEMLWSLVGELEFAERAKDQFVQVVNEVEVLGTLLVVWFG